MFEVPHVEERNGEARARGGRRVVPNADETVASKLHVQQPSRHFETSHLLGCCRVRQIDRIEGIHALRRDGVAPRSVEPNASEGLWLRQLEICLSQRSDHLRALN